MYCPQCGAANDDAASSCSACGFDLGKYKTQWESDPTTTRTGTEPAGPEAVNREPGAQVPGYQTPVGRQEPEQAPRYQGTYGTPPHQAPPYQPAPPYQAPPYQQQYQRGYQPPPYQPGYYGARSPYGAIPRIPSYLGWAIAVLILCFWPTGIAAVVYASQVDNKVALGDIEGAMESSRKAKTWCWVTFGIAAAFWVIGIAIAVIVAIVGAGVATFTY
jgi:hypothetical protein